MSYISILILIFSLIVSSCGKLNVEFSESNKVSSSPIPLPVNQGIVTTLISSGLGSYAVGLEFDELGNLFVADSDAGIILKIDKDGIITVFAGTPGDYGNIDGTGAAARFFMPYGLAMDSTYNLYVADRQNHNIRKISPAGVVTTFAGSTSGASGYLNGSGTNSRFYDPTYLTVDSENNVYVSDSGNYTIRKISPAGLVSTLAGSPGVDGCTDGNGTAASFKWPNGIDVDLDGNLFVADFECHTIRKITPSGLVTTFAGDAEISGSSDGFGTDARFKSPVAVAVDREGKVYITDYFNQTIRLISKMGEVKTLAGSVGLSATTDGIGTTARFKYPDGMTVDYNGVVYVTDSSKLRKIE